MAIYISQVKLTEKGLEELKDAPSRIEANRKLWEESGGKLLAWYVILGDYDYLLISEAPNEKVMTEIALKASRRGRTRFRTFTAIPIEEFAQVAGRL
ncbi:MAG: GYD domain-containing protein [Acidobacteriota bacterium]